MMVEPRLTLKDFLTEAEIHKMTQLWIEKTSTLQFHIDAVDALKPAMPRINERLGQENDVAFLAYAIEWVMIEVDDEHKRKKKQRRGGGY
jgi:hypothetical protein